MITRRPAVERGVSELPWLDSRHTFSFNTYYDARHVQFRALRVINDDRVAPGGGFGTHGHRDMEILSYVLSGTLEHADSMGNGSKVGPGELQRMTAGRGVRHSEKNGSRTEPVHFYQIWIVPREENLEPGYEQKLFPAEEKNGRWLQVASGSPANGALTIHQDVDLYLGGLEAGVTMPFELRPGRHAWVQVTRGSVSLNGVPLEEGDGAAVSEETALEVRASTSAEVMLFDLA